MEEYMVMAAWLAVAAVLVVGGDKLGSYWMVSAGAIMLLLASGMEVSCS